MKIRIIEDAIEVCEKHLDVTQSKNTQVSSCLTQYLVVLIYAKYEQVILDLIRNRAKSVQDLHVGAYVAATSKRVYRGLPITELSKLLGKFGDDYKAVFTKRIQNSDAHTSYDAILSARHEIAHGAGVAMTFADLCSHYEQSVTVLDAFEEALGANSNTP